MKALAAALMLTVMSAAALAVENAPPGAIVLPPAPAGGPSVAPDTHDIASRQQIAVARQTYRAACAKVRPADFCECMGSGLAQSVPPADLIAAARTVRVRAPSWREPAALNGARFDLLERQIAAECAR